MTLFLTRDIMSASNDRTLKGTIMNHNFEQDIYLDKKLATLENSDYYPFHMPGHKRQSIDFPNPYKIDITEIDSFDNLHHAEGILQEAQKRASDLYHTKETFYLINGSTCGILSAISAALPRGGTLLMGRNCHKAAYHAAFLRQLKTIYLMPAMTDFGIMGSIRPQDIADALEKNPDIHGVFLTSPTYDGVVSDIRTIAEIVHAHNLPLIVDEAHGAHFRFAEEFPISALECGADIVIHSVHKTLPCFTQTALLHVNSDRVPLNSIKSFLGIYETSSPSYLLMASIEQGLRTMAEQGAELMGNFTRLLTDFYTQGKKLKHLSVFTSDFCNQNTCFDWDFSKILISTENTNLNGQKLYDILREKYHIQLEMASGHYVTALTSVMDTAEGFERLIEALLEIDRDIDCNSNGKTSSENAVLTCQELYRIPLQKLTLNDAIEKAYDTILLKDAAGCISREYIYLYPPGIPLITPGEIITTELIENIALCKMQGLSVEGLADMQGEKIQVVRD
ncbi:aminotransferase class I/II-fold pyridoxal phosphate-dependent enzyme [Roseburia sp. 499]|uniref:aminotransferase class I/II-fold pyridoxal phosphate-dependent enzyme n=1 Tax=Roseburia sp. 499 TaxID=1261634 RepID=UPI001FA82E00|nr:aminotransferase class V-fold PLP-dependent enzyme [Roseburia sp. 499]WVK69718.1 aminotransferase class V-fold PLP-dependent enzyme [Roseburia sp. 499]